MKALQLVSPGGVENFIFSEAKLPKPADNEVIIETKAISINPIDYKTRKGGGLYEKLSSYKPLILGWDIAGVIIEVGKEVDNFEVGDRVFGMVNFPGHGQCYAEYVAAPAHHIAKIPAKIGFEQAAACGLAALTAWQALTIHSTVKQGDKVLIHAAAGGVGHFAVQIAHFLGAEVTGSASSNNHDFVKSLGANHFINYQTVDWINLGKKFDVILDTIGGENITNSLFVARKDATLISIPSGLNQNVETEAKKYGVTGKKFVVQSNGAHMQKIAELLEKEAIVPNINKVFTGLHTISDAHKELEKGHTKGKIVILGRFH